MKSILKAFGISILLHLLFMMGLSLWAPLQKKSQSESIEIALEEPSKELHKQIATAKDNKEVVRHVLPPDELKLKEDATIARLLSQEKQRVKEERQAAQSGFTENKSAQPANAQKTTDSQKSAVKNKNNNDTWSKDGYREVDISKELRDFNQFNQGVSTIGQSVPKDVKIGSFTALNTDRYLYYTFYARIEEMIRFRWESRVMQAISGFDRSMVISASGKNWNSQFEFLLDKNGILQKAILMKGCGIRAFDIAALDSFKEAHIFPNPPAEMIQEDGYIHITFGFDVNYPTPAMAENQDTHL